MVVAVAVAVSVVIMIVVLMIMIMMVMIVMVMIVMVGVAMSVRAGMKKCPPTFVKQPAADQNDGHAGDDTQGGNDLFGDDVARQQQRSDSQQEDADGVGEGDGSAEEGGMLHVAAGSDQIRGDDGLPVSGLQGVECAQPECDSDSGREPSGAQLGLAEELG